LTDLATAAALAVVDSVADSILVDTAQIGAAVGASISADIAAVKAETVLIVADTDALQSDWANAGRLDVIVDAILVDTGTTIPALLPSALVGGRIDADMGAISTSTDAADKLEASAETIESGAATATTLTTTTMSTNLTEATDNHYTGRVIIWTSGVLLRQATDITAYTGSTKLLTFTAVTEAPANTDTFVIV
jgi:hypothetical protein